ncbi:hypothetical protein MKW92_028318 [Papaver armeniacum]|nr:hypothetical protein MKW92_028318 [Papaver armeniacum]
MKIAAAIAQVEAIKESEKEAQRKLETNWKEIEEIKVATEEATKRAEMAEMAKKAIEGELRRWREREQKRAAEAASRILAETEAASSPDSSPAPPFQPKLMKKQPSEKKSSPVNEKFQKAFSEKISKSRKFDKNNGSKKLLPSLSGIFHKRKNQVEGGSPSYLPGEIRYDFQYIAKYHDTRLLHILDMSEWMFVGEEEEQVNVVVWLCIL